MSKDHQWGQILSSEPLTASVQSTDRRYTNETDVTEIVVTTDQYQPANTQHTLN